MKVHRNTGYRLPLLAALLLPTASSMAQLSTSSLLQLSAPTTTTTTTTSPTTTTTSPTTTTTSPTTTTTTTAPLTTTTTTTSFPVITTFAPSGVLTLNVPTTTPTASCVSVPSTVPTRQQAVSQTFLDNFNNLDLSTGKWTPHYNGGYDATTKTWLGYDWVSKRTAPGLHEQEIYMDANYRGTAWAPLGISPFVPANGSLHIIAQRTPEALRQYLYNFPFTSGMLTTRKSFLQRYGYFEMRAKVPAGASLVPAFWMLPYDKAIWPPELDIMEAPGMEPDRIATTVHWRDAAGVNKSSGCRTTVTGFSTGFHTYGALWTAERIVYYIDRRPVAQIATPLGMNLPMYMIVNLAVGGDWAGMATSATPIPSDYEIDWITAYTTGSPSACAILPDGVKQCPGI